jgi:hypothetical protein
MRERKRKGQEPKIQSKGAASKRTGNGEMVVRRKQKRMMRKRGEVIFWGEDDDNRQSTPGSYY